LKGTLHKGLSTGSALLQHRQKQIDILEVVSAAEDLFYGPGIAFVSIVNNK